MKSTAVIFFRILLITATVNFQAFAQQSLVKAETDTGYFPVKADNVVGIMGAFETEVELLKDSLVERQEQNIEGIRFYTGRLNGMPVVLTRCGIGKVNAALTTTLLLEHFRPRQFIFTGIAGAMNPVLHPGDIVVATMIGHHDYGHFTPKGLEKRGTKNPYNFSTNPVFFPADSSLLAVSNMAGKKIKMHPIGSYVPAIKQGKIITGDIFLTDTKTNVRLRKEFDADAVEMEGAAFAQVCYQQKVPFIVIRSLSDSADDSAALDFEKYGKAAAENSAMLVLEILKLLKR